MPERFTKNLIYFVFSLLSFLLLFPFSSFASDSTYVLPYKSGLTIRLQTAIESMNLEFQSMDKNVNPIKYEPNNLGKSGFKIAYNGLRLGLNFKSSNYGKDPKIYGETKQFSFDVDINTKKWTLQIKRTRTSTFFINNPGTFVSPVMSDLPPIVRNDIKVNRIGLAHTWFANHKKFSHKSLINQSERQTKSAGSFLLKSNFFITEASADTSFVPRPYIPFYPELNDFRNGRFINFIFQPGYGHNFVIGKRLVLSIKGLLGFGLQHRTFLDRDKSSRRTTFLASQLDVGAAIIYFNHRFFTGITVDASSLSSRIENSRFNITDTEAELFIGYRFPRVLLFKKESFLHRIKPVKKWIDNEF